MYDHTIPAPPLHRRSCFTKVDEIPVKRKKKSPRFPIIIPGKDGAVKSRCCHRVRQLIAFGKALELRRPALSDRIDQLRVAKTPEERKGIAFAIFFSHKKQGHVRR